MRPAISRFRDARNSRLCPNSPSLRLALRALLLVAAAASALPAATMADQASQPTSPAAGRIGTGKYHTCAVLSDGTVRCWGYGGYGALGYGNTNSVGASQTPASASPVNLGLRRTATAIAAGDFHTCALLDNGTVRCWGYGGDGRLGYGNTNSVGATQTPGSVGPVDLGPGRTAKAITAGGAHTCALLDNGNVRCWGFGFDGRLGYGNTNSVGATQTPGSVGPVDLGPGRTAKAITAGGTHTCAILDDGTVRCWGEGAYGQLGYGNTNSVGATQTPGSVGPVDLGPGRTAKAITAGGAHTCAILDDGTVRCWGYGAYGQLGYGNTHSVGATQTPGSVGPLDLGPGRTAIAISAGDRHTCALLDDGSVRCWGDGANGRLGYCSEGNVGDIQTPGAVGSVNLKPGDGGVACASHGGVDPRHLEALRAHALRRCLTRAARRPKLQRSRSRCLKRYGRTPGRIKALTARAISSMQILLGFLAPGSDATKPPAARTYLIKQSRRPIRDARSFMAAQTLCNGYCRFNVTLVNTRINLTITHLAPNTTYYYAIAARDNVSGKLGPRSPTIATRTR